MHPEFRNVHLLEMKKVLFLFVLILALGAGIYFAKDWITQQVQEKLGELAFTETPLSFADFKEEEWSEKVVLPGGLHMDSPVKIELKIPEEPVSNEFVSKVEQYNGIGRDCSFEVTISELVPTEGLERTPSQMMELFVGLIKDSGDISSLKVENTELMVAGEKAVMMKASGKEEATGKDMQLRSVLFMRYNKGYLISLHVEGPEPEHDAVFKRLLDSMDFPEAFPGATSVPAGGRQLPPGVSEQ